MDNWPRCIKSWFIGIPKTWSDTTNSLLNGPIPTSFCLFSFISHTNSKIKCIICSKFERKCAWESNLGQHYGRRWRFHWAMAGAITTLYFLGPFLDIPSSVTRMGDFFKLLGDKISDKSRPNYYQLFCHFETPHTYVKTHVATPWVTFGNILAFFYLNIWSHWFRVQLTWWSYVPFKQYI